MMEAWMTLVGRCRLHRKQNVSRRSSLVSRELKEGNESQ